MKYHTNVVYECINQQEKKYDYTNTIFLDEKDNQELERVAQEDLKSLQKQKNIKSAKIKIIYHWR